MQKFFFKRQVWSDRSANTVAILSAVLHSINRLFQCSSTLYQRIPRPIATAGFLDRSER